MNILISWHRRRSLLIAELLLLSALLPVTGLQAQSHRNPVDSVINTFMAERQIPGFAACVVKGKSVVWSNYYGTANREKNIPMGPEGIINIGSISKTFVAAAAMQLWEKGLLDLDADINQYLDFKIRNPKYPDKPITVFQLLTHTSSTRDGEAYYASYSCGDPVISLHDWIQGSLSPGGKFYNNGDSFGDWTPGAGEQKYSNIGFGLLGLIVERIAGEPFNEYCKKHIFVPLGMQNTGWLLGEVNTANHIIPYAIITAENEGKILERKGLFAPGTELAKNTLLPYCLYSFPNYPDGLVRTTLRDLSLYLIAMMNGGKINGNRILKKTTVHKMLSLQLKGSDSQGLAWHRDTLSGQRVWGHKGGDPGIAANLFFNTSGRTGVITIQNILTGDTFPIVEKIYQLIR